MNSQKNNSNFKIFLYIFSLGFIMFLIFTYISYKNYQQRIGNKFEHLSTSINYIIKAEEERIIQLYRSRLVKNIKTPGVIEAFKNKDREKLYELINPRYLELKKENKNFVNMHFHNKDNTSFLRMHQKEKYGDDLSSFRKIVVDTNAQKKVFFGFEDGKYGYFYRIIIPVFDKETHLGSVEFGLTLNYFIENLRRLIDNTKFGLVFKEKNERLILDENDFFKSVLEKVEKNKHFQLIEMNDKAYLYSDNITIKDYKGSDVIKILIAQDVTEYKNQQLHDFLFLLFLGGLTYAISFLIIDSGFKQYIKSIEKQSRKLKKYNDIIDKYVIVSSTDLKGNITYASDAFCRISGYSKDEILGKPHNIIRHEDMPKSVFQSMWTTLKEQMIWEGEIKNKKKDGSYYWVEAIVSPMYDDEGRVKGYTAVRNDITNKKLIEEISQKDKLTGVFNRVKLDDVLENEHKRAKRYKSVFSIILLDIDKFKSVNDTYGHQTGDSVLVQTALILSKNIRDTDILGRWGGEEFLIICPNTTASQCKILAEHLRKKIEAFDFDVVSSVTSSFGVAQYEEKETINDLIKRCDNALYEAKNNGRNQVAVK